MAYTPFKMKGFSGFKGSPLKIGSYLVSPPKPLDEKKYKGSVTADMEKATGSKTRDWSKYSPIKKTYSEVWREMKMADSGIGKVNKYGTHFYKFTDFVSAAEKWNKEQRIKKHDKKLKIEPIKTSDISIPTNVDTPDKLSKVKVPERYTTKTRDKTRKKGVLSRLKKFLSKDKIHESWK